MPYAERYRKNRQACRDYSDAYAKWRTWAGFDRDRTPETYAKESKRVRKWVDQNRARSRLLKRAYQYRLAAEAGGWSKFKLAEVKRRRREERLKQTKEHAHEASKVLQFQNLQKRMGRRRFSIRDAMESLGLYSSKA